MGEQLTRSDVEKIREEIEYRKLVVRKRELEAVKEARAQGDLSENFEYKAAKQDKNRNESRIRYLEKMLKNARIVSDESKDDEVGINNTVTVYFEEDDETETYRLVTSVRGNSMQGLISIESPMGKAIRGHKTGDRVLVKTDGGDTLEYAMSTGFMQFADDKMLILADAIEGKGEIDLERAQAAYKRARERLEKKDSHTNMKRAELSLQRAINRIHVGS